MSTAWINPKFRLDVGLNLKNMWQDIDGLESYDYFDAKSSYSESTVNCDVGFLFQPIHLFGNLRYFLPLRVGGCFKNFLHKPTGFKGAKQEPLPKNLIIGVSYLVFEENKNWSCFLLPQMNWLYDKKTYKVISLGLEFKYRFEGLGAYARSAYIFTGDSLVQSNLSEKINFGIGIQFNLNNNVQINFDYSPNINSYLGSSHQTSIGVSFCNKRSDLLKRNISDKSRHPTKEALEVLSYFPDKNSFWAADTLGENLDLESRQIRYFRFSRDTLNLAKALWRDCAKQVIEDGLEEIKKENCQNKVSEAINLFNKSLVGSEKFKNMSSEEMDNVFLMWGQCYMIVDSDSTKDMFSYIKSDIKRIFSEAVFNVAKGEIEIADSLLNVCSQIRNVDQKNFLEKKMFEIVNIFVDKQENINNIISINQRLLNDEKRLYLIFERTINGNKSSD